MTSATLGSGAEGPSQRRLVPVLQILWHPDVARVGQICPLVERETKVGRLEPLFSPVENLAGASCLADRCLSRSPYFALVLAGEGVRIVPLEEESSRVFLNGEHLEGPA